MNIKALFLFAACLVPITAVNALGQEPSLQAKLVGKWKEQSAGVKDGATLNITSVDPSTGQLKGKWIPPSGAASGKEFEVIGWVSTFASPDKALDHVDVITLAVSLSAFGSVTSYTGFLKDDKIVTLSHNVRPNSRYEWDHITANESVFTRFR